MQIDLERIWCWGSNSNGQLGIGNTTDHDSPVVVFIPGDAAINCVQNAPQCMDFTVIDFDCHIVFGAIYIVLFFLSRFNHNVRLDTEHFLCAKSTLNVSKSIHLRYLVHLKRSVPHVRRADRRRPLMLGCKQPWPAGHRKHY